MKREVISYDVLDSTNDEAVRILSSRVQKWPFFITTDYQTAGRGQSANFWVSDKGKNILLSWTVFPEFLSVTSQFQLSKAVSLAISDVLSAHTPGVCIKWPNDIIAEGKKIGGILIENSIAGYSIRHSIIGIGVNINQLKFPTFENEACSLASITGKKYALKDIQNDVMHALENRYAELEEQLDEKLNRDYLEHLFMLNKTASFSCEESVFEGRIRGINEIGEIMIESDHGLENYGFHQVRMLY